VVGALGTVLVAMVARLTVGKKAYADVEKLMEELISQAEELRSTFQQLAGDDVNAFNAVMEAYRLPQETAEQKAARRKEIQTALRGAAEVPLRTMRASLDLMQLAVQVLQSGNSNAASDAAVAAELGAAALQAARYNVDINLTLLEDSSYLEKTRNEAEEIACESTNIKNKVDQLFKEQVRE
jgi:glutamate formiminotransferase/formiminotetrahydrofolate cyclodeaminase